MLECPLLIHRVYENDLSVYTLKMASIARELLLASYMISHYLKLGCRNKVKV